MDPRQRGLPRIAVVNDDSIDSGLPEGPQVVRRRGDMVLGDDTAPGGLGDARGFDHLVERGLDVVRRMLEMISVQITRIGAQR